FEGIITGLDQTHKESMAIVVASNHFLRLPVYFVTNDVFDSFPGVFSPGHSTGYLKSRKDLALGSPK
ncbi:MAG: hypothetical protein Q9183_004569, partial [Haloplaca sp. 2 TL-2023]